MPNLFIQPGIRQAPASSGQALGSESVMRCWPLEVETFQKTNKETRKNDRGDRAAFFRGGGMGTGNPFPETDSTIFLIRATR